MFIYMDIQIHIHIHVCMHVRMQIHMYVYICMYTGMYLYMQTSAYIHIEIHTFYIYIFNILVHFFDLCLIPFVVMVILRF